MRINRLALCVAPASVLLAAGTAHAGTCEETFAKKGSVISGMVFTATRTVPDLAPPTAIRQMRGIVTAKSYDIMADEADYGSLLIEQPMTGKARAFPIEIKATEAAGQGTVVMQAKLRAGQTVKSELAMAEMCGMLNSLVGGKAGLAAAKRGQGAATVQAAPVKIDSLSLSQQISKDTERNAAGVLTRYKGKQFTVTGMVDYVTKDGDKFRISYKIPHPYEQAIRLPNQAPFKTDIVCYMAGGQAGFALQQKPGKSLKLTGTVMDFDEYKHVLWLGDCRDAKVAG